MRIEVNRRHVIVFLGLIVIIAGLFIVTAYGTNNPGSFGHTLGEVENGSFRAGRYVFPNSPNPLRTSVVIGNPALTTTQSVSELYITDSDNSNDAGINIVGTVGHNAYIDFYDGSVGQGPKANIVWNGQEGAFKINDFNQNSKTIIGSSGAGSIVGIGQTPISDKLEVAGRVKATGFCIGASCISTWPSGGGPSGGGGVTNDVAPVSVTAFNILSTSCTARAGNPSYAMFVKGDVRAASSSSVVSLKIRPSGGGAWTTFANIGSGSSGSVYGSLSGVVPKGWEYCFEKSAGSATVANVYEFVLS